MKLYLDKKNDSVMLLTNFSWCMCGLNIHPALTHTRVHRCNNTGVAYGPVTNVENAFLNEETVRQWWNTDVRAVMWLQYLSSDIVFIRWWSFQLW